MVDIILQQSQQESTNETEDVSMGKYGEMNMIQSKEKFEDRKFIAIKNLNKNLENQMVWLRGRLHTSRAKGKRCFILDVIVIICANRTLISCSPPLSLSLSHTHTILQASNALSC